MSCHFALEKMTIEVRQLRKQNGLILVTKDDFLPVSHFFFSSIVKTFTFIKVIVPILQQSKFVYGVQQGETLGTGRIHFYGEE